MLKLLLFMTSFVGLNAQEADFQEKDVPVHIKIDYNSQLERLKPKLQHNELDTVQLPWIGYVRSIEGSAYIKRHDRSGNLIFSSPAQKGDLVAITDIIDVSRGGRIELGFKDRQTINLGTSTILQIDDRNSWTLFLGSIRVRTKNIQNNVDNIYAPNAVVSSKAKSDFVVRYNGRVKTTTVASFFGKLELSGVRDSKDLKGFERELMDGDTIDVVTTHGKDKEDYLTTDIDKLTMDSKKDILESFYTDPEAVGSWEYTRASSSFFRFAPSFEYSKFKEETDSRYNFSVGYVPLVFLGSIFYFEPYFFISLASPFDTLFFRAGGSLQINPLYGFYVGIGGGLFWIHGSASDYSGDFVTYAGFTFPEKVLYCIDGIRGSYFVSRASHMHQKALMFSIVFNLGAGRELY